MTLVAELRHRAMRWSIDNGEKLDGVELDLPPGFDNRLGDNWKLRWPSPISWRRVAVQGAQGSDRLFQDRRNRLGRRAAAGRHQDDLLRAMVLEPLERMSSADLAAALGADGDSPWAEWKGGKPITQAQLARVLKPFRIAPEGIRLSGEGTPRGYMRRQFEDVWGKIPSAGIARFQSVTA